MKIMHIAKKFPRAVGGDSVVVSNLQQNQLAQGHEVVIVTSNCNEIIEAPNIYKVGLKDKPHKLDSITLKRLISLLMLSARIFRIVDKERPDVIHTHSIDMAFAISLAAWFYNIPLVHTFHIVTFYDNNQSPIRRKTELWLAKRSHFKCVTAPNEYDVAKLRGAGLNQAKLLSNGVDLSFWQAQHLGQKDVFCFLAIGRLEPQKGYEYLISATAQLNKLKPGEFKVIIVGSGSQYTRLKQMAAKLRVGHIVSFLGQKGPQAVKDLLAGADVMVLPSLYETTPITLLEAWAARTPVIATPVGILRDSAPGFKAAKIVPCQNEPKLLEAMANLLSDSSLRQGLADSGFREAQKYSWPNITAKLEGYYWDLA